MELMNNSENKLNNKINWFFKLEPNAHEVKENNNVDLCEENKKIMDILENL